jgi:hypothetical protein
MSSILKPARVCLATLLVLVVQFATGMIFNLYFSVPASDAHASFVQEVKTAPLLLTIHALLGTLLVIAAVLFVIRSFSTRDRLVVALAAIGLVAIMGAFVAGEKFVKSTQTSDSLTMALLTATALACYITALGRLFAARVRGEGAQARVPSTDAHAEHGKDLPGYLPSEDYLTLGYGVPSASGPQRATVTGPVRQDRDFAQPPVPGESQAGDHIWGRPSGEYA